MEFGISQMSTNGFVVRADSASSSLATSAGATRREPQKRELSPLARAIAAEPVADAISPVVLSGVVRTVETLVTTALGIGLYFLLVHGRYPLVDHYVIASASISFAALAAFEYLGLYHVGALRTHIFQITRLTLAWCVVFLGAFAISFFADLNGTYSRIWAASYFTLGLALMIAGRVAVTTVVRRWARQGRLIRRVIIVGGGAPGEALIEALSAQADSDLRICGVFDDRNEERSPPIVGGIPKLGTVDDLVEFTRRTRVDLILVSLPLTAEERVLQMVRKLWVLPVDMRLAAHMNKLRFRPRAYSYIGNVPVLDIFDKPIAHWDQVAKAIFDRVVGGLALIAALPIMAAVAVAVRLDSPGPILFRQKRYGFNNEKVEVFKFRSLYHNQADQAAAKLVTVGDPRVTRVGRFIRKTSLDELPQLFNVVFKGNLSLVGPRPHALNAKAEQRLYEEAVDGYFARHKVKPGITGWAQINGWRGDTDTQEKIRRRIEHDLYYIENWSILFDLYIVLRTPFALIKAENAY
jgi:Undecaprenyl-phosphate glucose phosphotransferase